MKTTTKTIVVYLATGVVATLLVACGGEVVQEGDPLDKSTQDKAGQSMEAMEKANSEGGEDTFDKADSGDKSDSGEK